MIWPSELARTGTGFCSLRVGCGGGFSLLHHWQSGHALKRIFQNTRILLLYRLPCDIGGAKEPGMMYFPTKWGAKEPQNPQNHRVVDEQKTQPEHVERPTTWPFCWWPFWDGEKVTLSDGCWWPPRIGDKVGSRLESPGKQPFPM